jgi:hypothetical protein
VLLATLRAALSVRLELLAATFRVDVLLLRAALLLVTLRVALLFVTLRVAAAVLRLSVFLATVAAPALRLAPLLMLRVAPVLLLARAVLLCVAVSREILVERLLAAAVDLVAVFTFEEEPLLLLDVAAALLVAAPLLAGELFCTLVEEVEAVLAVLLDCPITSVGLTHIITMMRESAISANFFMTVICLG